MELSTQEQQRLRQEWLTRTGRTAASVAHTAISEEESDLESVEATPTYLDGIPEGPQGQGWLNQQMEPMIRSQMGEVQIMGTGAGHSTTESQLLELGEQVDQEIWT